MINNKQIDFNDTTIYRDRWHEMSVSELEHQRNILFNRKIGIAENRLVKNKKYYLNFIEEGITVLSAMLDEKYSTGKR